MTSNDQKFFQSILSDLERNNEDTMKNIRIAIINEKSEQNVKASKLIRLMQENRDMEIKIIRQKQEINHCEEELQPIQFIQNQFPMYDGCSQLKNMIEQINKQMVQIDKEKQYQWDFMNIVKQLKQFK